MCGKRHLLALAMASVAVLLTVSIAPGSVLAAASAVGQDLTGSWMVTDTQSGQPAATDLVTFTADGGMLVSEDASAAPESGRSTTGHGAWTWTGDGEFAFTFVGLHIDPKGRLDGTFKVSGRLTLGDDSDTFSGPFKVTASAPDGKALFSGEGSVKGTRITVESMPGMPSTGAGGLSGSAGTDPAVGLGAVGVLLAVGALMVARCRNVWHICL